MPYIYQEVYGGPGRKFVQTFMTPVKNFLDFYKTSRTYKVALVIESKRGDASKNSVSKDKHKLSKKKFEKTEN